MTEVAALPPIELSLESQVPPPEAWDMLTEPERVARFLVDRFWAPVGSGVEADREVEFLATYLFGGPEGLEAARKVDDTIRRLPGFETVALLEAWMDRHARSLEGGLHGHGNY